MLHIDPVGVDEIRAIDEARGSPSVSLFMATQPATIPALREDRVAFRDLAREARRRMEAAEVDKRALAAIDERLSALAADDEFWRWQAHGLAVFVSPEAIRTIRLPMRLDQRIEISDRFHVKPLTPLLARDRDALVLELSQKRVRLLEVGEGDVRELDVGLPADMDEWLETHRTPENTNTSDIQQSAEKKMRQRQFAHGLDQALAPTLRGRTEPLVLAGVESILGLFREACSYPRLAPESISGNHEHTHDQEIAERARAIAERAARGRVDAVLDRVAALEGENRGSTDLAEIARAAEEGRVDTLVVSLDEAVYGRLEDGIGSFVPGAESNPATYDVLDELVGRTLRTGGSVAPARRDALPEGVRAAAVFRYAA